MGKEIGHEIITWDPKQNAYSTIVVGNSFPDANIGTSKWDGNNLVIVHDFEFDGTIFHLRSTITKTGENSVHVEEISQYAECHSPKESRCHQKIIECARRVLLKSG